MHLLMEGLDFIEIGRLSKPLCERLFSTN